MLSAKGQWTQGEEVAVEEGMSGEGTERKGSESIGWWDSRKVGLGKCASCCGREGLEGLMTGKNEKGGETNSD